MALASAVRAASPGWKAEELDASGDGLTVRGLVVAPDKLGAAPNSIVSRLQSRTEGPFSKFPAFFPATREFGTPGDCPI